MNKFIRVTAFFTGVEKRKRKEAYLSHHVANIPGHDPLTPEQFNDLERKFWAWVDNSDLRVKPTKGSLSANIAWTEGDIINVQLMGQQRRLIERSL